MAATIQEMMRRERRIKELNNILVEQFDKAVKNETYVMDVDQNVIVSFDFCCIPDELKDLFIERKNLMWGEISNSEKGKRKKYFYCKWVQLETPDTVTAKLIRNW